MAKKRKIPKKVAGIKVPKMLRKSWLMKSLLGTSMGRQILADALVAGAAAAAAALVAVSVEPAGEATKSVARTGKDGLKRAKRAVKDAADAMTNVIGDAAKQALADVQDKGEKARDKVSTRPH
jgi:hypothetical protein